MFIFVIFFLFGCAYFAQSPNILNTEFSKCNETILVKLQRKYFWSNSTDDSTYSYVFFKNLITKESNQNNNEKTDEDSGMYWVLKSFAEATGCSVTTNSDVQHNYILEVKYTESDLEHSKIWPVLTGATLGLIPSFKADKSSLVWKVSSKNKYKDFYYENENFFIAGILALPLMPFADSAKTTWKNYGAQLAISFCEFSSECRLRSSQ